MEQEKPPEELPEGHPLPYEANPGGTEGVDSGWTGGSSNLGEILNPEPEGNTTYSTKDLADVPRTEVVRAYICKDCGAVFNTESNLNLHRRTAHRPR
jgi:hypothetical protein